MLISHRRSAYLDDDELERAAGLFEIKACGEENTIDRSYYAGAAGVLRVLNAHNVTKGEDLITMFERLVFDRTTEKDSK